MSDRDGGVDDFSIPGGSLSGGAVRPFGGLADHEAVGGGDRAGIVTARGTADGLILRLDGAVGRDALKRSLWEFLESRRAFIAGNEIMIEWVAERPHDLSTFDLEDALQSDFSVRVKTARQMSAPEASHRSSSEKAGRSPSLFDGIEALGFSPASNLSSPSKRGEERSGVSSPISSAAGMRGSGVWDDADARIVYGPLRSGQRVETEHSVVIVGDVNSGAEIVAGGDVIVLGCLRGTAHAGAYDETGGGRTIFGLALQPTQLRIGSVISRGGVSQGVTGPEIARVEGTLIVVEAYQSRAINGLRR